MIAPCNQTRRLFYRSSQLFGAAALLSGLLLGAGVGALATTVATDAWAKGADEKYGEARKAYEAKDYEKALKLFLEVDKELESPNARMYAGLCLRALERYAEAYETLDSAAELAAEKARTEPRYAKTRDEVAKERERLVSKVARVTLAATDRPPGLRVTIDERIISFSELGKTIALEPGEHEISAHAEGYESFNRLVVVDAGKTKTIAINMVKPTEAITIEGSGGGALFGIGLTAAGLGVAGFVTFAVTGSMADSTFAELETECPNSLCADPATLSKADDGATLDTIANVGLGVGIGGLVVGGVLMIIDWPNSGDSDDKAEDEAARWHLDVGPVPGGAAFSVQHRF